MRAQRLIRRMGLVAGLAVGVGLVGCGESGDAEDAGGEAGTVAPAPEPTAQAPTPVTPETETPEAPATNEDASALERMRRAGAGALEQGREMIEETGSTLEGELAARRDASADRVPADAKAVMARATEDLSKSGIVEQARGVGDQAPMFELTNALGETVTLPGLLKQGPVVLVWYRGGWCPYCNLTLRAYQEHLDEIGAAGATLVAISPELPDKSLGTKDANELGYQVLSDEGNRVANRYGVVFTLDPALRDVYRGFGIDLPEANGDGSWTLPLAATYVIGTDGEIKWAFVDADYTKRAEPSEVVAALHAIDG